MPAQAAEVNALTLHERLELIGLTLLTTLLGFLDLGSLNTAVAVLLAAVKACLIAAFFMHGLHESKTVSSILRSTLLA